jgi:primosomal protein N' (replication factor Y)
LELLQFLASSPNNVLETFQSLTFSWQAPLRKLVEKGWVTKSTSKATDGEAIIVKSKVTLNSEQMNAKSIIERNLGKFRPIVLYGVTGSGKTEVYFEVMQTVILSGKQVLFLLPEIALTKHLISRFRERFGCQVALLHSARSNSERISAWQDCLSGRVSILLGTRSAVWFDLPNLGVIIVDEEHDSAYKQYDGFKYSARDIAIVRAKKNSIPIILGSATPSFETLANIKSGKYDVIKLLDRPSALVDTSTKILDVRGSSLKSGLSNILIERMRHHLDLGQQVVLFLNRRGYAPLLICRNCGDIRRCYRCDAYLVYYKSRKILSCHHCGYKISLAKISACCEGQNMEPIGLGTESIEEEVKQQFPNKNVVRVDRDSVKSGDSFEIILHSIEEKKVDIVIGTQMISKGLDFENVTLVGVVDADSRLYSIDFRAEERLAQLLIQVTGRAGRGGKAGEMVLQTHRPDNPVLRRVIDEGYETYSNLALAERELAQLPPYVSMVIIRAESQQVSRPKSFLLGVKKLLEKDSDGKLKVTDPIPALMAQRAGRHRYLLVIRVMKKSDIHNFIQSTIPDIENLARKIKLRWAIDVDPHDTL